MARNLDPNNLSDDDKIYINQRPWLVEEYERNGFDKADLLVQLSDDDDSDFVDPAVKVDDFPSYTQKERPEGWADFTDDEKRAYIYGDAGTSENEGDAEDDNSEGTELPEDQQWSEDMTNAQLEAVIEARNEDREEADVIEPDGSKKADLIAALTADDEMYVD